MPEVLTKVDPDDSVEKLYGRDLDEAVAGIIEPKPEVIECEWRYDFASPQGAWIHTHILEHGDTCQIVPRCFSSDIALAMRVVEKIGRRMEADHFPGTEMPWCVMFPNEAGEAAWSKGLAEAICRAALKALGAE